MPVVYVAGPFRGTNAWEIERNIRRAEALAFEVWMLGGVACICPHTNTRFFDGTAPNATWLDGDIEMMRRCDAVIFTPDWERSAGARAERVFCDEHGIRCFDAVDDLRAWLRPPPESAQ